MDKEPKIDKIVDLITSGNVELAYGLYKSQNLDFHALADALKDTLRFKDKFESVLYEIDEKIANNTLREKHGKETIKEVINQFNTLTKANFVDFSLNRYRINSITLHNFDWDFSVCCECFTKQQKIEIDKQMLNAELINKLDAINNINFIDFLEVKLGVVTQNTNLREIYKWLNSMYKEVRLVLKESPRIVCV